MLPDGAILATSEDVTPPLTTIRVSVLKLQPTGAPDPQFQAGSALAPNGYARITGIRVQPNGRILLFGDMQLLGAANVAGVGRLLPSGTVDPDFDLSQVPERVGDVLVQPDGALVLGGSFRTVAGLPVMGLTRLLDNNVLRIRDAQADARTAAWPVPAHDVLHLSLDAASRPTQVELFDAAGHAVRRQVVHHPELSLRTAGLAPGLYLLRVTYGHGPVTRRIVVE